MDTTSKLMDQPLLILHPEILVTHQVLKEKNYIPCLILNPGTKLINLPSTSKSAAAVLENQGKIVALRRVSLST